MNFDLYFLDAGEDLLDHRELINAIIARCMMVPDFGGIGGTFEQRWGKLDESLPVGGTAEVSLWEGHGGEHELYEKDSGENVTGHAWPGQNAPVASPDLNEEDVFVRVTKMGARWYVDLAPCPPEEEE